MEWTGWFEILQSFGIVAGLLYTAATLRLDLNTRRVENRMAIVRYHRELWKGFHSEPKFSRILDTNVDLRMTPTTAEEQRFVELLILHLGSVLYAWRNDLIETPSEIEADIREFFSLPIPRSVWEKRKHLRDPDLIGFVERAMVDDCSGL